MSLYDKDNNWDYGYDETIYKHYNNEINGLEHEIVIRLKLNFSSNGKLNYIDSDYWKHYTYTKENGMECIGSGTQVSCMDDITAELFEEYTREILK